MSANDIADAYVAQRGLSCPYCYSPDVRLSLEVVCAGQAHVELDVICDECCCEWKDVYCLVGMRHSPDWLAKNVDQVG